MFTKTAAAIVFSARLEAIFEASRLRQVCNLSLILVYGGKENAQHKRKLEKAALNARIDPARTAVFCQKPARNVTTLPDWIFPHNLEYLPTDLPSKLLLTQAD